MGYLDDFLKFSKESAKDFGKKAAEVGLGALEQLNRPAAAVTETIAEAGKGLGRTAGALTSWLSEEEAPQLGEAFTPEEKLAIAKKEDEATAGSVVSEALTGLGKTAIAPIAGFLKNKSVSEILAEKQGATPTPDTVTEATKANVAAIQEAKQKPEALAQLKKEGGLPVNAQETWSEFLKKPTTRELIAVPAMLLDPLLYGSGIGAKTAKGIEAAKTTEGMAPTLLGQFAEGERTAVGLGKLETGADKLITISKGGKVSDTLNSAISNIQKGIDYVSNKAASGTSEAINKLANEYPSFKDGLDAVDAFRKAIFNRSSNKEYNEIQELLINNGKTRANAAEEFLKGIEQYVSRSTALSNESALNRASIMMQNKGIGQSIMPLSDNIYSKLPTDQPGLMGMFDNIDEEGNAIKELYTIHNPTAADIVNRPMASLNNIRTSRDYIQGYPAGESTKDIPQISDSAFSMLKAKGYVKEGISKEEFYTKPASEVWTETMTDDWNKRFDELSRLQFKEFSRSAHAKAGSEASNMPFNESLKYIMDNSLKTQDLINPMTVSPDVINYAKILPGWDKIKKFFDADSLNDISRAKFLSKLITPEAAERARKLKQNIMSMTNSLLDDIGENINYSGEQGVTTIGDLNDRIKLSDKFKELTDGGKIKIFSDDPVKVLTSYGLGLGDNRWRDNIYSWIVNKTGETGSDMFRKIKAGDDAPEGYVSLWREKLPEYAVKEDLYAPLSDTLGKIVGAPKPETLIQDYYNKYMQLWKKSVLTGIFGLGYGYAVRNITSEALKTAQSGFNTTGELAKTFLGQASVMADKVSDLFPSTRKYLKPLDYFKNLGGASQSVIDGTPWLVRLPDGTQEDAYKLAQKFGVIDSGFFAEEVFNQGQISDKVKIKFLKADSINKAKKEYQDMLKVQEPLWKDANLDATELRNSKHNLAYEIAERYDVPSIDVFDSKPLPEYVIPVADGKDLVGYILSTDAMGAGALANNAEKTARLTTFGKALQDGYTPEAAARLVGETSFNYADISDEARTMKTMIPFLTFYLKNIPFQLGKFISEPKVQRYLQHGLELSLPSKEELDKMSDYEKERLPLNTKVPYIGGTGMRQYLAQFQGLGLAQEIKEGKLGKAVEEGLKDVVSAVNPLMRLAIELGTGTTVPGSRTTPLGATGGNILGMDRPIERYTGEKGNLLGIMPVPKKVEYATETLLPPVSSLGKLIESGTTKGVGGAGKQALKYMTGVGAPEPKTAKEIRRAERSDKIAIQQDIRKSRLLLRRYKKDLKDGKISQSQFDLHKEALKNLEVELKKAYRTKKPVTIQEGSPVSDMLKEVNKIELPEEQTETSVSPLMNFFETPVEEQAIKPSIIKEFTAPEIKKVKSPIDEFINSEYNNTGDDNMSKEVADKAINFALRNEDDSYDKNAKLENLNDGAGLTFIGLTEKYDEAHLKNKYGVTIKQLADMYKSDKARALQIIKDTYRDLYWNKAFDNLKDEKLAIRLFDLMLNRGAGGLRSILSNAGYRLENLNDYIDKQGKDTVYKNIVDSAEELYRGLKNFNRFGTGWLNRLKRSEYTV